VSALTRLRRIEVLISPQVRAIEWNDWSPLSVAAVIAGADPDDDAVAARLVRRVLGVDPAALDPEEQAKALEIARSWLRDAARALTTHAFADAAGYGANIAALCALSLQQFAAEGRAIAGC